jgi:hypothetical protein
MIVTVTSAVKNNKDVFPLSEVFQYRISGVETVGKIMNFIKENSNLVNKSGDFVGKLWDN